MSIGLQHFLFLSGLLFATGFLGVLLRRNALVVLMSVELMLVASMLGFAAFSRYNNAVAGNVFTFFIITVAAAEVAVGLAILVALYRKRGTVSLDELNELKN